MKLTHLNEHGEAHMVDVGGKTPTKRQAVAESTVILGESAFDLLTNGDNPKGDVLSVARVAGIQAAKKCAELIPLCHPLMLTKIWIDFEADASQHAILIRAGCELNGKTGVEMEALTAASVAALTIYDMCKAVNKGIIIQNTQLLKKSGGKSGEWSR